MAIYVWPKIRWPKRKIDFGKQRVKQDKLHIVPMVLKKSNEYVDLFHRHHKKVVGCKFCVGVIDSKNRLHGVAISGRPVARNINQNWVIEVNRLCTDGFPNACSCLYSVCARIAAQMGYKAIITYILESESGVSLKAAGWKRGRKSKGGSWSCKSRKRIDKHPLCAKRLWYKILI